MRARSLVLLLFCSSALLLLCSPLPAAMPLVDTWRGLVVGNDSTYSRVQFTPAGLPPVVWTYQTFRGVASAETFLPAEVVQQFNDLLPRTSLITIGTYGDVLDPGAANAPFGGVTPAGLWYEGQLCQGKWCGQLGSWVATTSDPHVPRLGPEGTWFDGYELTDVSLTTGYYAGSTIVTEVRLRFYGEPSSVPEPSALALVLLMLGHFLFPPSPFRLPPSIITVGSIARR